ncbi:methyltransferase type 12 [Vespertiliibacter pulmonis]|nr:methyltransferase type 12 [Vespertiliibacter pulmonis]
MKGLDPAPLANAKVLEIGCSYGGNLLPYAIRYPNSQIVGIDLAEYQINVGKQMMQAVGVENVELVTADISQVSFKIQFDYIICHGVFSWVPESVQQAILQTIQDYLAPNGIAYVSYNTYPGWKIKDIAKELMLFSSHSNLPLLERAEQSFGALKFTSDIFERSLNPFANVLANTFKDIMKSEKYYIAHEYFEGYNNPLYFKDFIQKISKYNLSYVTDSTRPIIFHHFLFQNEEYNQICQFFENKLESVEQYVDFIENRQFRTSIITHKANLDTHEISNNIEEYSYCHHFYDIYFAVKIEFVEATPEKAAYWTTSVGSLELFYTPLRAHLFEYLQSKNEPCKVRDVFDWLSQFPEYNEEEVISTLFILIHSYGTYLSFSPKKASSYKKKPKIIEKYRNFIKFVMFNPDITNLSDKYYQPIKLDFFSQHLAQYLDGTRTIADLTKQVRQDFENGTLSLVKNGIEISSNDFSDKEIKQMVNNGLKLLDINGFFDVHLR